MNQLKEILNTNKDILSKEDYYNILLHLETNELDKLEKLLNDLMKRQKCYYDMLNIINSMDTDEKYVFYPSIGKKLIPKEQPIKLYKPINMPLGKPSRPSVSFRSDVNTG